MIEPTQQRFRRLRRGLSLVGLLLLFSLPISFFVSDQLWWVPVVVVAIGVIFTSLDRRDRPVSDPGDGAVGGDLDVSVEPADPPRRNRVASRGARNRFDIWLYTALLFLLIVVGGVGAGFGWWGPGAP